MSMIYITGASSSGKSSVIEALKMRLPKEQYDIHDIDESDLWTNDYEAWRLAKIDYWLQRAISNEEANITTILCGIIYPQNVEQAPTYKKVRSIHYYLLDASPQAIIERFLKRRGTEQEKRLGRPDPGSSFESKVKRQIEISQELKAALKDTTYATVLNATELEADEVAELIENKISQLVEEV